MFGKHPRKRKKRDNGDGFEKWGGYMNAKISKLEAQFDEDVAQEDDKLSNLFKGISIFVNGYTEPSADELRCIMLQHGGVYHHYYRSGKTTHIIASSLPNAKFDQMRKLKVVKCEWITDSVKAGKVLDYTNYLLLNDFPNVNKGENLLLKFAKKEGTETAKQIEIPKTAADDGYLTEFYNNSRLHYISALGAMLKQYVLDMREKHNGVFPGRKSLLEDQQLVDPDFFVEGNVIIHIDMDCFFVAVALRNHPELKGKPVAVTHSRGGANKNQNTNRIFEANFYKNKIKSKIQNNSSDSDEVEEWSKEKSSMSEIASCSYEARKAGVYKGMYLGAAFRLCPDLKTVPYDFKGYEEVSMTLYNTVAEYTLDIEAVSCDELFIDYTSLMLEVKMSPLRFVETLRQRILEKTSCTASAGLGSNKLQARLATKRAKPNGQYYLTPSDVDEFMKYLPIKELPGVGRTINSKLKSLKIRTCEDMQQLSLKTLQKEFGGKTGETLYKNCRGIDERKVNFSHERKSVSAEVNYGIRFNDDEETETFLKQLSEEVAKRLKNIKMMGKNITFKVMFRAKNAPVETAKFLGHGACDQINRSVVLAVATNDGTMIAKHIISLYHQLGIPANELRGLGIHVNKLETSCKTVKRSKTLQNYFKGEESKEKKKTSAQPKTLQLPTASQIDPDVLASLPEEIKREIVAEYGLMNDIKQHNENTSSKSPENSIPHQDSEIIEDEAAKNIFSLSLSDMRVMIKEWVAAEPNPQSYDINMLNSYLRKLVKRKNLENVGIIIKCLHRHISNRQKDSEIWKNTYKHIIDAVQNSMLNTFGKTLAVECL